MVLAASIDAGVRMRVPILRTSPAQEQGFETKYRSYEDRPDHHDGNHQRGEHHQLRDAQPPRALHTSGAPTDIIGSVS